MRRAFLGIALSFCVLGLDQASKLYLLWGYDLPARAPVVIAPFLNLTVVWNYGVSYGLFQKADDAWRWFLVGVKIVAAFIFTFYLFRARSRWSAISFGLIIGGAIGNAIDRIIHGAVFDFAHFHLGGFDWYVFNLADVAIVTGAFLLFSVEICAQKRLECKRFFSKSTSREKAEKICAQELNNRT